eukprot:4805446-Pyramimonas_sp.AAC.1
MGIRPFAIGVLGRCYHRAATEPACPGLPDGQDEARPGRTSLDKTRQGTPTRRETARPEILRCSLSSPRHAQGRPQCP